MIVPAPRQADSPNFCRTIMNLPASSVDIWIKIPVFCLLSSNKIPNSASASASVSVSVPTPIGHTSAPTLTPYNLSSEKYGGHNGLKKRRIGVSDSNDNNNSSSGNGNGGGTGGKDVCIDRFDRTDMSEDMHGRTDSWTLWDNFRHGSDSDKRVHVALLFTTLEDVAVCTPGELELHSL